jgi:DNA-directed RNA polymerase subunit H (RpoH/RPB5)
LPYLYIPIDDWLPIAQALQNSYGDEIKCIRRRETIEDYLGTVV